MAGQTQLSDAILIVNNEVVGYDPNSLSFTEGTGERKVRAMSSGGGVEQVFSNDQESAFSDVAFALPSTVANIALVKTWLDNGNTNVVQIVGSNADGNMTRTFTQAAITNKPKVELGSESSIEVELMSNAAI